MKSTFRYFVLLLIVMLLAVAPSMTAVHAQGGMCLPGLQQADCDLITAANGNVGNLNSFQMTYSLKVNTSGLEGVQMPQSTSNEVLHDVNVSIDGNGPFSIDKSKIKAGQSTDPLSALQNVAALTMGNVISASVQYGTMSQKANIEFRIVSSKLYFKTDNADMLPPQLKGNVNQWMMSTIDTSSLAGAMSNNPSLSGAMMGGAMMGGAGSQYAQMAQQFMSIPGFITTNRQEAGGDVTYTININVQALLKSDQFKPTLKALLASQGGGSEMTDQQLTQMLAMISPYFQNFKLAYSETIGSADKLLHGITFNTSIQLTGDQVALVTGTSNAKPLNASVDFSFKMANVNQPVTVQPVADAKDVTNMMGGGMGASPEATAAQ